jgi:hypothetical protein
MPRSSSGKWVARAGATGGGRTYRGQMPVNWYAALVVIILVGLGSVIFARYEYEKPAAVNTTQPTIHTTWYAGIGIDVCGNKQPSLVSDETDPTHQSFFTLGDGVVVVSPKSTSVAGDNAVLGRFVSSYPGMKLTSTELTFPKSTAKKSGKELRASGSKTVTYRDGERCPSGTKDAGKKADVVVSYGANAFAPHSRPTVVSGDPGTLKFSNNQLITIGFVPPGTKLPQPSSTVVTALLDVSTGKSTSTTTTTTAPSGSTTTTTAPTTTTTTAPKSTTTTTSG